MVQFNSEVSLLIFFSGLDDISIMESGVLEREWGIGAIQYYGEWGIGVGDWSDHIVV
jgi:hypothetical protein